MAQGLRVSIAVFYIFEDTRHFMILLKRVMSDIVSFTIIFIAGVCFMSFFILVTCKFDKSCMIADYNPSALRAGFQMSLVDNSYTHSGTHAYIVYVIGSSFLVIIMLNLLIAVLSATFDNVYNERKVANTQAMAELLLELSPLFTFK